MRKWFLALVTLLSLSGIGRAAFWQGQTYAPPANPQIFYNIVTDGGAACNGDVQTVTRTTSTSGASVTVTANTFVNAAPPTGDVGKGITIPGAGNSGGTYYGTITAVGSFSGTQTITVSPNTTTSLSSVSKDITYGSNDAPNFATFNTWALANQGSSNQVVLTIPNGSNCWFGTSAGASFAAGINNFLVEGTGATISGLNGWGFQLGGTGVCQRGLTSATGCSARIQSVSSGATQVTLMPASLSAGYISRFNAGCPANCTQWIMIGGLNTQALWDSPFGYPQNFQYFEWRKVTAADAGTGVITLDRSLTNSYLSTWPEYNSGSNFETDAGGPASIFAVGGAANNWNTTVEYRGLTISKADQTYAQGRNVTYRNVTFTGTLGGIPTQNETWSAYNTTWGVSTVLETDKLVGVMLMDGVTVPRIDFQSSSTDLFILRNSTMGTIFGLPTRAEITDTSFSGTLRPGAYAYGASQSLVCTRCSVTTFDPIGGGVALNRPTDFSMSSGVISFPNTAANGANPAEAPFVPPKGNVYWSATGYLSVGLFNAQAMIQDPWPALDNQTATTNVTIANGSPNLGVSTSIFSSGDVGKVIYVPLARATSGSPTTLRTWIAGFTDAQNVVLHDAASSALSASSQQLQWGTSNVYIQTNEAGSFPTIATNYPQFRTHPAPQFTCDACTGDPVMTAMNIQRGATPLAPLGAYASIDYAPASAAGNLTKLAVRGKIVSLTIDVTQAYSGTGSATLNTTGQFNNNTVKQSDWAAYNWVPTINLKQAGTRVITPSGTTCNDVAGPCAGDSCTQPSGGIGCFTLPEAVWFPDGLFPYMGSTLGVGNQPQFTITIQTDQGVVN